MINILIMDDKQDKIDSLCRVIRTHIPEVDLEIQQAQTIVHGTELMQQQQFDLLILDMVMPIRENEDESHTAGADYLTSIYENQSIKKPLQIIGITEYQEEFTQQQQQFRDRLWHLLFYSRKDRRWEKDLERKVLQLYQLKTELCNRIQSANKYDVAIICALPEEFKQVLQVFSAGNNWQKLQVPELPYMFQTTTVNTINMNEVSVIAVCADAPGVCATSVLATTLYSFFHVDSIFMTGITAGIKSKGINLGDIVIAKSIQDYAAGKLTEDKITGDIRMLKELEQIPASKQLISMVSTFINDDECMDDLIGALETDINFHCHIAPTVCGPFVMASPTLVNAFKQDNRKIQALDMEGYALYLTAFTLEKKALWVKAISDYADNDKNDDYHEFASRASATFLYQFFREML